MRIENTSSPVNSPRPLRSVAVLAWLRLARVFQKVDHLSAAHLRNHGLTVAQFDVLAQLRGGGGLTQQDLADSLLVTKGNVCQLLDRMQQSDLLFRRQEGRSNHIFLTEKGQALADRSTPCQESRIADAMSVLSDDEQAQLLTLLRRLDRALE